MTPVFILLSALGLILSRIYLRINRLERGIILSLENTDKLYKHMAFTLEEVRRIQMEKADK